jgi:hypothetical protein
MRLTPPEMARAALLVTAALSGSSVFSEVCEEMAGLLVSAPGYDRPTTSALQQLRSWQGLPELPGSKDLLLSAEEFTRPHIAAAQVLDHPLASLAYEARHDLSAAVDYVLSFGRGASAGRAIAKDRHERMERWADWRRRLADLDGELLALRPPWMPSPAKGSSIAIWAAFIKAAGLPDAMFPAHLCSGFPCVGDYPDSGWFRLCERPATATYDGFCHPNHNSQVESNLMKAALDPQRCHELQKVTEKTRKEVFEQKCARGLFTSAQIDVKLGKGTWRALQRFGVTQGLERDGTPKVRPCDNAKSSRTNECLSTHETISCEQPSFPALVAALFAAAVKGGAMPPLMHSTDDVELAYRRMLAAHPEVTVVAIYDTVEMGVRYYTMDGHNFGLVAAVLSFNRHSQLMVAAARRHFGVPCCAYFDDYDTTEPTWCGRSGKLVLHRLHVLMGIPLAGGDKDVDPAAANPFLGVVSDLSAVCEGLVIMRAKTARVASILYTIHGMVQSGSASHAAMRTLVGKVEYTSSTSVQGRFGRAALAVLRAFEERSRGRTGASDQLPLGGEVLLALTFLLRVLPLLRPKSIRLWGKGSRMPPVIVYTDARYERSNDNPAEIGIVIFDRSLPAGEQWRHASALVPEWLMQKFRPRQQYIGQLEVLAAVAAYTSNTGAEGTRGSLRGRDVVHFIDNTGALFGLQKGYSGDLDSARLIHVFHAAVAAMGVNPWLEFVPSGANIADLPSRGEFSLLQELGSEKFDVKWPLVGAEWLAAFEEVYLSLALPPSRAMKRQASDIGAELQRLKAPRRE